MKYKMRVVKILGWLFTLAVIVFFISLLDYGGVSTILEYIKGRF